MANSIEDASTIVKDKNGEVVLPVHKTFAEKYEEAYESRSKYLDEDGNLMPGLSREELHEHWMHRQDPDDYLY